MSYFDAATFATVGVCGIGGTLGGVLWLGYYVADKLTERRQLRAQMAAKWKGVCE